MNIDNKLSTLSEISFDYNKNWNFKFIVQRKYKKTNFSTKYEWILLWFNWQSIDRWIEMLFSFSWDKDIEYGTILSWFGKIEQLVNFDNDFDYVSYMLANKFYATAKVYSYDKVWDINLSLIRSNIESLRKLFTDKINNIYPNDEAILLWWILIWSREELPKDFKWAFIDSWLMHFMAVSWYNITIMILFFSWIFYFFPRKFKLFIIPAIIFLFAYLVWDSPSVVRSSIMWIIWYWVIISGRQNDMLTLTLLTMLIMSIINPYSLNFDISFHLSFLAVFSIIYLYPIISNLLSFLSDLKIIKESIAIAFSALVFTLPISVVFFWQFSIVSIITNVLVSVVVPISMFFWFLWVLLSEVTLLSWYVNFIAYLFLDYIINIAYFFSSLKYSVIDLNVWIFKLPFLVIFYLFLFLIIYKNKKSA